MTMHLELCTKDQYREFLSEFDATENSIKTDARHLMEWLEKQPHLPNVKDEEWLENFLLRGKNSIERTKKLLENYYTARALLPDIFTNRSVYTKEVQEAKQFAVFVPVTKLTPDGRRVMIFRILQEKGKNFPPIINLLKCMQIILDVCLRVDRVKAVTLVYDAKHATIPLVTSVVAELRKIVTIQNKINPIRYDRLYVLNIPSYAQPIFHITSLLIKKQYEKLVLWRKKPEELVEVLPKECLPSEYGGTGKPIHALVDDFYEDLKENNDWLVAQESVKADLTKLPLQSKLNADINGVYGSFKKLNVD